MNPMRHWTGAPSAKHILLPEKEPSRPPAEAVVKWRVADAARVICGGVNNIVPLRPTHVGKVLSYVSNEFISSL